MHKVVWILIAFGLISPSLCRAENCPWLNAATAGGLLGGDVSMKVIHTNATDTTCNFTLESSSGASTLQIAVHTMTAVHDEFQKYVSQCGSVRVPLGAVGNEAVQCRDIRSTQSTNQIISRVRERAFLLVWTTPCSSASNPPEAEQEMQEKMRNVAEQVAGSLF